VAGRPATFTRTGDHELVITPGRPVAAGAAFVTEVRYRGQPTVDRDGQVTSGWFDATTPGGGFIAGEPHSCTVWYPCNDHPTDRATFALTATVPKPFQVVSVGLRGRTTPARMPDGSAARTYRGHLDVAVPTYETTIYIDQLSFEQSTLPDGTPVVSAYGPDPGQAPKREAKLPKILDVLSDAWGPYPAPAAGGIFVNGEVPFSLETYTRPIYTEGADLDTIVHENGHQWWGDNVAIQRWKDICLNECFASYSVWLWDEAHGDDLDARYHAAVDRGGPWMAYPLYDMGPGHEFDGPGVYYKGVFFLHALRRKLGDDAFFSALQGIQLDFGGRNLSMDGLRDELEARTGADLTSFWDEWVLGTSTPSDANLYPGTLAN
jgi:aminopeptidase N